MTLEQLHVRSTAAALMRQELDRGGAVPSMAGQNFVWGFLRCARIAEAITLSEENTAFLAVSGSQLPEHLPEWWKVAAEL